MAAVLYEMWCAACGVHLGNVVGPAGSSPEPKEHACDPAARLEESLVDAAVEAMHERAAGEAA